MSGWRQLEEDKFKNQPVFLIDFHVVKYQTNLNNYSSRSFLGLLLLNKVVVPFPSVCVALSVFHDGYLTDEREPLKDTKNCIHRSAQRRRHKRKGCSIVLS